MKVSLPPELGAYLRRIVDDGRFTDANAAIRYAMNLLRAEDAWFAENADELRREIAIGLEQANRGEFVEFTAEEICAEGRRMLAAKRRRKGKSIKKAG